MFHFYAITFDIKENVTTARRYKFEIGFINFKKTLYALCVKYMQIKNEFYLHTGAVSLKLFQVS